MFRGNDTWKPNNWSVLEEEEAAPLRRDLSGAVTAQPLPSPPAALMTVVL